MDVSETTEPPGGAKAEAAELGQTPGLSTAGIRRGAFGFIFLSVVAIAALFWLSPPGDMASIVRGLDRWFLLLAVLSATLDLFLGPLRFHVFLRKLSPGKSFWLPFRADLVGRFLGSITPSQTGGGPGQIFVFYRGRVKLPTVLTVLMVNLVATQLFLVAVGGVGLWIFHEELGQSIMRHLVVWGFTAYAVILVVLLGSAARPDLLARPLGWIRGRVEDGSSRLARGVTRACDALARSAHEYKDTCLACVRRFPSLPILALVLSAVLYLNKFFLAWLLVRGLGVDAPLLTTLAIQALITFLLFVAPTPGGSGIAEATTAILMAVVLPLELVVPFTLAWRFLLGYVPAAIGALFLAYELRRDSSAESRTVRPVGVPPAAPLVSVEGYQPVE